MIIQANTPRAPEGPGADPEVCTTKYRQKWPVAGYRWLPYRWLDTRLMTVLYCWLRQNSDARRNCSEGRMDKNFSDGRTTFGRTKKFRRKNFGRKKKCRKHFGRKNFGRKNLAPLDLRATPREKKVDRLSSTTTIFHLPRRRLFVFGDDDCSSSTPKIVRPRQRR